MKTAVVIMAAGKGTRMKSSKPKVLHEIGNWPMLFYVVRAGMAANPEKFITMIGHEAEQVETAMSATWPDVTCVLQEELLGTGHTVLATKEPLKDFTGTLIILTGDCPLVTPELVTDLISTHRQSRSTVTFISTIMDDPTGLGRVLRDCNGNISTIVEHKDATPEQHAIKEINTGIYAVETPLVFDLLAQVTNDNAQGEYYLPDIIPIALKQEQKVSAMCVEDGAGLLGINSRRQQAFAESLFQQRQRNTAMDNGVTLIHPESTFFSWDTTFGTDITLGPNTRFGPGVKLGDNVHIEGSCYLSNCTVEENAHLLPFCYLSDMTVAKGRTTEPFTSITPDKDGMDKLAIVSNL